MNTRRNSAKPTPFRRLPSGPMALLMGTHDEIAVFEPLLRQGGLSILAHEIDPVTLDVETIVLDEALTTRVETCAMAVILADVSGDDRLPLLSFVDDALPADRPILASCTQAGVNEQAAICQHQHRLVGFGPLGLLSGRAVVELASGLNTSDEILEQVTDLFKRAAVQTVRVGDAPGLVLGRVLLPIVNEAVFALSDGVATADDIDRAMRLGANYPFGPLHWADVLGLDRVLLAMEYLVQATHEERYRPAPLLRRMAQAGRTGKSAGVGFFEYRPVPNLLGSSDNQVPVED
jgi:3-hydroxybutyryl-CoA dehydrogenase